MITQSLIIALIVLSIHYTMQPGEIFSKLGEWLEKNLPESIHPAVFACNVCMCFWHGSYVYWIGGLTGLWNTSLAAWLPTVIVAMGLNIVFNKWEPKDCNE